MLEWCWSLYFLRLLLMCTEFLLQTYMKSSWAFFLCICCCWSFAAAGLLQCCYSNILRIMIDSDMISSGDIQETNILTSSLVYYLLHTWVTSRFSPYLCIRICHQLAPHLRNRLHAKFIVNFDFEFVACMICFKPLSWFSHHSHPQVRTMSLDMIFS